MTAKSQYRYSPLTDTWVLIAPSRAKRPKDTVRKDKNACPFCIGNEDMTPEPEIFAVLKDGNIVKACYKYEIQNKINKSLIKDRGWKVRVVPNKFGALGIEGEPERTGVSIYQTMNGIGTHDVLIEHPGPEHIFMFDQDIEFIELSLLAMQERNLDLKKDKRFRYSLIFKNHGEAAGASLEHSHCQQNCLIITPRRVQTVLDASQKYYMTNHHCIFCRFIKDSELTKCLVEENEFFIALAEYAARFPYEVHIYPKYHDETVHLFELLCPKKRKYLAAILKNVLRRLKCVIENQLEKKFSFNFEIFNSPWFENYDYPHSGDTIRQDFHWHIQIQPRDISKPAGFEFGSGYYINSVSPEDEAAEQLRSVKLD